jgi:hypothetical protein
MQITHPCDAGSHAHDATPRACKPNVRFDVKATEAEGGRLRLHLREAVGSSFVPRQVRRRREPGLRPPDVLTESITGR